MKDPHSSLSQLIVSLEQATFMAKQLSSSSNSIDPTHLNQIRTSLHQAHQQLSVFLSTLQPPPAEENSVSSANGAATVQLGDGGKEKDDEDDEETSKCTIDKVEEKLRECFIKNKRTKRPLPPSVVVQGDNMPLSDDGFVKDYDPHSDKMKELDLVYQFHG